MDLIACELGAVIADIEHGAKVSPSKKEEPRESEAPWEEVLEPRCAMR